MRQQIALLALVLLFSYVPSAHAANSVDAHFGCAPWDGRTLDIKVGSPDLTTDIRIWAKGIESIQSGAKKLSLVNGPNSQSHLSMGYARQCSGSTGTETCQDTSVLIDFTVLDMKPGGKIQGSFKSGPNGMPIEFEGIIAE